MTTLPPPAEGGFCAEVWARTAELQRAIVEHPFNAALAEGTLDRERFAFYIVQDGRYLVGFAQALAAASSRAPVPADAAFLAASAHTALAEERNLHAGYVEDFGLSEEDIVGIETSPTCLAYTSYLRAAALTEPYPVLVAAILPCFWVYQHVGSSILRSVEDITTHPYRAWIETYADEDFAESVRQARDLTDRLAESATVDVREQMTTAFTRASEYEWLFWNSAWEREQWPTRQWVNP